MSEQPRAVETRNKTDKVTIFVKPDMLNNEQKAEGSINGRAYSFNRGETVLVTQGLAEHMITCGQAQAVKEAK